MSIKPVYNNKVSTNGREKDKYLLQVDFMNVSDGLTEEYLDKICSSHIRNIKYD